MYAHNSSEYLTVVSFHVVSKHECRLRSKKRIDVIECLTNRALDYALFSKSIGIICEFPISPYRGIDEENNLIILEAILF